MNVVENFELKLPPVISTSLHLLTILLLLLFGFNHLLFENFFLGISCFFSLLVSIFSLISLLTRGSKSGFMLFSFLLCLTATLTIACYFYGERGLVYSFPLSASMFFLMRFKIALFLGGSIILLCCLAALNTMDQVMVARFFLAMVFSFICSGTLAYQLSKQQRQLEREANEDYLTGLMNQRSFYNWLEGYLSNTQSERSKLTLFYFDIDNFKSINDSFGHAGGDLVLKEFSERIITAVTEMNTEFCIQSKMNFCRLSGDEFVLACTNTEDLDMAADFAKRFHDRLTQPFAIGGRMTLVHSSIGVHHFVIEGQTASEVMQLADAAMYKAKKTGEQQFYISEDQRDSYLKEMKLSYEYA